LMLISTPKVGGNKECDDDDGVNDVVPVIS
jgi:hypothetical protein